MTQHTISPVTLATCVEHSLHLSLDGFDLSRARLYGISIVDEEAAARNEDGALRITFLAEHGDVYELLEAQTSAIVRMFDAAVVLTCGWAAPIRDDDDEEAAPRGAQPFHCPIFAAPPPLGASPDALPPPVREPTEPLPPCLTEPFAIA